MCVCGVGVCEGVCDCGEGVCDCGGVSVCEGAGTQLTWFLGRVFVAMLTLSCAQDKVTV